MFRQVVATALVAWVVPAVCLSAGKRERIVGELQIDLPGGRRILVAIGEYNNVRGLLFGSPRDRYRPAEVLAKITEQQQYGAVSLVWFDLAEDDLLALRPFVNLRRLKLAHSKLSEGAMRSLASLAQLAELDISNGTIRGSGESISQLKNLRVLKLGGTNIGDSVLRAVGGLRQLETLEVGGTAISDVGLLEVKNLTSLKSLAVGGEASSITDEGVAVLRGFRQLQALSLRSTQVTNAIGPILAMLRSLEELDLSKTAVDSGVVEDMGRLPLVRAITLANTRVDDQALKVLATLPRLERLDLRGTRTTRAGWAPLFDLANLTTIDVDADIPKAALESKTFGFAFDLPPPSSAGRNAQWRLYYRGLKSGHQLVEIRDNATGQQVGAKLIYPAGFRSEEIICHSFSPDGKYVVLGGGKEYGKTWNVGHFIVWEIGSGEPVFLCRRRPNAEGLGVVRTVAFTADSRHIFVVADKFARNGP